MDGNSFVLDGTTYQLHGIDAPEAGQICSDGWPAGYEAEEYLGELIDGKQITCIPLAAKSHGETAAICRADGVDLGAAMVTGGYAFAFVPYSARYISQEDAALRARRGVHAHNCLAPWKWRARLEGHPLGLPAGGRPPSAAREIIDLSGILSASPIVSREWRGRPRLARRHVLQ